MKVCCAGAYPNFKPATEEVKAALTPEQRAQYETVEKLRAEFIASLTRAGLQAPIACADLLVAMLASARASMPPIPPPDGVFVGLVPENASGWIVLSVVLVAAVLYGVGAFIIEREVSQ